MIDLGMVAAPAADADLIKDATEATFMADVIEMSNTVPVIVDFWAPWCGPCRAIAPHVEALGEEFAGRVTVAKVNVDNNQQIAMQYGIRGIPAILVFKDGKVANQMTGMPANALNSLRELINSVL